MTVATLKLVLSRVIVCWVLASAFSNAWSRDMGAIGKTWEIVEEDMIAYMKKKMQTLVDNGEVDRKNKEMRENTKKYMARPKGIVLPRAKAHRVHEFDPTFVLDQDIVDPDGKVHVHAGTMVNPLSHINMQRALCFFDGDDPKQMEWVLRFCGNPLEARLILVNGPLAKIMEAYPGRRFFFDQYAYLVKRLGVAAVPSVVRQSGEMLMVEEFPIED